ncbi:MAG: hypothetical protein CFH33_00068 [Alphaproteobacteria bacterium MarineAlpha9_Bin3]|nr:MAG: hypothetical protein CFH33_00068 [Alphaproteobacteria bacterium MarineAlpha9_Bin3]|tara:strand:- start:4200 stop:4622 length:423 start_codon:yes stop_codon:yes gene_type:complete
MRVSNTPKRHRSRNNNSRRNNSSQKMNPYENNKENKIKGNAIQVHEKYQSLARDAITSGDIIKAEYYFQHAEHYHRVHKLSQNNQIDKKQKNVVNIHKDKINTEKDKIKLDEKNEVKNKEEAISKSNNSKTNSKDDTQDK